MLNLERLTLNLEEFTYDELIPLARLLTNLGRIEEAENIYNYLTELINSLAEE